jgi:hypothetical protein
MSWLTQLCPESYRFHKCVIILLPDGMSFLITPDDYALHVICQDKSGNPHIRKGMEHADKEVFLLGIRKELHVPLSAVVADHGEAGDPVNRSLVSFYMDESPVHLVGFTGIRGISAAAVALWCDQLTRSWNKVFMFRNVIFDCCFAAGIA